jgi:hypothetical protein
MFVGTTPAACEAMSYHDTARHGYVALLIDSVQRCYRLAELQNALSAVPAVHDVWLSQSEFWRPQRQLIYLACLPVVFVDLETRKSSYSHLAPESQARALLLYCEDRGIPRPSRINFSGRGLHGKWILADALVAAALPRWNAVQSALIDALTDFVPDRGARSGSQCLRVVGTMNPRSGEMCRTVYDSGVKWDFEILCNEVLPLTRQELQVRRTANKAKAAKRESVANLWSPAELWWNRLEDIRTLIELRGWQHGVPVGCRNNFLFVAATAVAWGAKPQNSELEAEIACLAREFCPLFTPSEVRATTCTVIRAAKAGTTAKFTSARLVEMLEVTIEEQRRLKTLIDDDERKRRRSNYDASRSRGKLDRATYEAKARERREQARALRNTGLSYRSIAEHMGISVDAVDRLLRQ